VTSPGRVDTVFSASRAWSTAAPEVSSSRCPVSVSATVREVRVSSVTPRRASSCRTDWLSADGRRQALRSSNVRRASERAVLAVGQPE
jgi:hypothetical protein